jgi:2,4-dienoyl-CoA reductase-like NADH-dependent reductase (Old Yellow Enzyme family)/thioredoxin reductase
MFILPGTPYGKPSKGRPAISEDDYIRQWKALKAVASTYGMHLFCQLHPSKIQAGRAKGTLKPEDYPASEIPKIIQAYAEGALRAKKAGLDGVEVHAAHAHEIAQFLSPFYNRRNDKYGGDLEGRSRMGREIIQTIKKLADPDFPVIFRFGVEEYIPGGRELEESIALAKLLEDAGADGLHTDVGTPQSEHLICPPMDVDPGFSVHLTAKIKKSVSIPVIAAGRINDIALAAQIIQEGHADLVTMGRALLADPDLPVKSQQGRFDDIRHCVACNQGCRASVTRGEPVVCFQNPRTGREGSLSCAQVSETDRKTVLIAGAGPAGLEAACVLAEKGHRVKLYEKKSEPGGAFLLASKPPFKSVVYEAIRHRLQCLQKMNIEINLNREVDVSIIEDVRPDVVIIATGSVPLYPSFPIKADALYSPDEVFSGKLPKGDHVLIIGGGIVGCETGDYLADKGYRIHLAEQLTEVATGYHKSRRYYLLERLKKNNVQYLLETRILAVEWPRVRMEIDGREEIYEDYDSVIYAVGRRSNDELRRKLEQRALPVEMFTIGDAASPRSALEAIQEAALVSAAI